MSIQHGKMNLTVYRIDTAPDCHELLEAVAKHAAPPIEHAKANPSGESIGWTSGEMLLCENITEENSLIALRPVFHLRSTVKKIDAGLLKAVIQREEANFLKVNGREFVPRKERKRIKEEAIERLIPDAKLTVKGVEVVVDGDLLLIGSTSEKDCDTAIMLLYKDSELEASVPKHTSPTGDAWTGGRQFLTWLFGKIQRDGNDMDEETQIMVDGPIEVIAGEPDNADTPMPKGSEFCTSATLRGDLVVKSGELRQSLETEKKLIHKAKLRLTRGERIWAFTFDADKWTFGSLELPKDCEDFADRLDAIRELHDALEGIFNTWKTAAAIAAGIQELPNMEKK